MPTQTPTHSAFMMPPPRDGQLKSLGLYPSIISMHNHIYLYFPNTFLFKLLLTCSFHLRSGEQISEAFFFFFFWPHLAGYGILFPEQGSNRAPCIGSVESEPMDYQGSPHFCIL